MSINQLTDTSYLKGAPQAYQLNLRCYNLLYDGQIINSGGGLPRGCISKSITTVTGLASGSTYLLTGADYEDFLYSYDSGDILFEPDGTFLLVPGVYNISCSLNIGTTNGQQGVRVELIDYINTNVIASATALVPSVNFNVSINFITRITQSLPIAFRVIVGVDSTEAVTIQGFQRASYVSINKLL